MGYGPWNSSSGGDGAVVVQITAGARSLAAALAMPTKVSRTAMAARRRFPVLIVSGLLPAPDAG
ncbi:MAG: hypothetical protein ACYDAQ_14115 [Mycobacteriales bacterium]